ncbi:MAG: branched-chain amino acid ABC transporter permease [Reyranella sp.]|uniref:branched-chain amino acid ABC transporter permease n=1 Tax=Reyranella sp. TaxID=1929291 RepID=UPI003D151B9E
MLGPFLETLIGGLLTGVLYSLVALGFVLIFKASGVFNFAQGAMVLFAALTLARLTGETDREVDLAHFVVAAAILGIAVALIGWYAWREYLARGGGAGERRRIQTLAAAGAIVGGVVAWMYGKGSWPMWLAIAATAAIMGLLAYAIERLVLRHLVNQEGIILFMATLGIANFLDGFGQTLWGSDIYKIDLGMPKDPIFLFEGVFEGGLLVDPGDLVAAVIAAALVVVLAVFFQKTRVGRALRAVADDHAAAQSVGIPLDTIWLIVWTVSGLVALVAGMMWGAKLGVQFSISLVALKALPVLILGGFTSVPGAIVGGLIIGAGEKLSEVFLAPILVKAFDLAGGGIENWFAYMLALIFLLFRPQGLFGERIIERV